MKISTVKRSAVWSGLALVAWLILTFTAAAVGSLFLPGEWYARLNKPTWNPPGWIFGPVWTFLYTVMAIAAWLIWKRGGFTQQRVALSLFLAQLLLNMLWSPLFFGLRNPMLALVDILLLWIVLLFTAVAFWKTCPRAGIMMVPYLAWVTFASALNFTLWRMNP